MSMPDELERCIAIEDSVHDAMMHESDYHEASFELARFVSDFGARPAVFDLDVPWQTRGRDVPHLRADTIAKSVEDCG